MFNLYSPLNNDGWLDKSQFIRTVVDPYSEITGKRYYNHKQIYDKVDRKQNNIIMLRVDPELMIFGGDFKYYDVVSWAKDNDIKVYLDYSWENVDINSTENKYLFHNNHRQYIEDNDIKIISQCWNGCKYSGYDSSIEDRIINFSTFEFNIRLAYELHNKHFNFMSSPTNEKKYFVNYIPGDIRKHFSSLVLYFLLENFKEEEIFYSTIIGDYFIEGNMCWEKSFIDSLTKHISRKNQKVADIFKNVADSISKLHVHKPFEERYNVKYDGVINQMQERAIPPGVYQSKFSLIQEVAWANYFYTEKTFKHVIAEQPFLILSGPGVNIGMKELDYEIFEEVFNYTYDSIVWTDRSDWGNKSNCFLGVIDNIQKLKENRNLLSLPSVKEKTTYNRHNLLRRTNIDMFEKELERIVL